MNLLFIFVAITASFYPNEPYDAMFLEVQEHWVIDSLPFGHPLKGLDPMFGSKDARLIRILGCNSYEARQLAYEILEGRDDVFRLLVWGYRHRDRQVVFLCDKLLSKKYYKCFACQGRGFIGDYGDLGCDRCNGAGDIRKGLYNCYTR